MALTQITATYLVYSSASPAVLTTATVVIPVPAGLQTLDSGQTAASQTGFNAMEQMLAVIAKRGILFTDANGVRTNIPKEQIVQIVAA